MQTTLKIAILYLLVISVTPKKDYFTIEPQKYKGKGKCQYVSKFYTPQNTASIKTEFKVTKSVKRDIEPNVIFSVYVMDKAAQKSMKSESIEPDMEAYCEHMQQYASYSSDVPLATKKGSQLGLLMEVTSKHNKDRHRKS